VTRCIHASPGPTSRSVRIPPHLRATDSRLRHLAVMFTDIVDSTGLVVALGDQRWFDVLRRHDAVVKSCIRAEGGRVVARTGDGALAVFDEPGRAIASTLRIQRAVASQRSVDRIPVHLRIGIHWAEAVEADGYLVGRAVHEAARLTESAGSDEIVASSAVVKAAVGSFSTVDERFVTLRGIPDPIAVVTIRPAEAISGSRELTPLAQL
jgi:class 3 adenylate cyclase